MSAAAGFDAHSALVVVDVQNDFADPRGNLYVAGGEEIVPVVNRLVQRAREAGAVVVYTQDWHPAQSPHFATYGGPWPVHCVAGTWGAELHPALSVVGPVVRKGTGGEDGYSGFSARHPTTGEVQPTDLDGILRAATASRLVICGLALDVCVRETVVDASRLGYATVVALGASRAVELAPGDRARSIEAMTAAGAVLG